MFAKSGELLTMRLRKMAFESMLKQVSMRRLSFSFQMYATVLKISTGVLTVK